MVRELSPELQEKAIEELNEDPGKINENLAHIKAWLENHEHIKVRVLDDQWLLGFLRGCKFNLLKTKEKIEHYHQAKTLYPFMTSYEDPFHPRIQRILEKNLITVLPYSENSIEPRILFARYDEFDTNTMDYDDILAVSFMIMTILMIEDDVFIISGFRAVCDLKCLPFKCYFKFTPNYMRAIQFSTFKALPLRLKGLCILNINYFTLILTRIFKSLLPKKISDKFFIINKSNLEDMYKCIPKKDLPKEYGGDNDSLENIGKYWKKKIESYSDWFKKENVLYNYNSK